MTFIHSLILLGIIILIIIFVLIIYYMTGIQINPETFFLIALPLITIGLYIKKIMIERKIFNINIDVFINNKRILRKLIICVSIIMLQLITLSVLMHLYEADIIYPWILYLSIIITGWTVLIAIYKIASNLPDNEFQAGTILYLMIFLGIIFLFPLSLLFLIFNIF